MPATGSRVGRYVIEQRIGEGGMGVVFRAFDPEVGRSIALKFARARHGAIDGKVWSRLRREAKALGRIRHPGVVGLYEMGQDAKGAFLALELVSGVHLRRWLQLRARPQQEVVTAIERAAVALGAVHQASLLHRDIKPTNILLDTDDRVVLIDFGLALGMAERDSTLGGANPESTCRTRLTRTNMVVGTTNYMSPEQLLGRDLDARSDVFSLAVTACEALCGDRPFAATTPYALALAFDKGERPVVPRGLGRQVRSALLEALEIDPAQRTASVAEFAAALRPRRSVARALMAAFTGSVLLSTAASTPTGHRASSETTESLGPARLPASSA